MTTQEYADRELRPRGRRNTSCEAEFAVSDVPPLEITNDPELATAWVMHRSKTIAERSKRRLRRLDD